MNYEINFLILQSQTENVAGIKNRVKELIKNNGGTITDELSYQKRKLAYEIKHEQYGFFTVYRFDLENGEKLKNLTKDLNLENGVTRHIIVKSEEIPELQKEIGKAPKTEEERKAEAMKNTPKKKIGKKILDDLNKETLKKSTPTTTTEKPKKETAVTKKRIEEKTKIANEKATKAKKEAPKETKSQKKEEISIDDLDKKLDEILDI